VLVVNKKRVIIGHCAVRPKSLHGNFYVVPTMNEGEFCRGCGYRHTFLSTISFCVCVGCTDELALMAEVEDDAKKLPGFKRANR